MSRSSMKRGTRLVVAILIAVGLFAVPSTTRGSSSVVEPQLPHAGLLAASIIRECEVVMAGTHAMEAFAALIESDEVDLEGALTDLNEEYGERLALAEARFAARYDVLLQFGIGAYDPAIDPSRFSPEVTNTWFPLVPGRTLVYENSASGSDHRKEVTTRQHTVTIEGVVCRVVHIEEFDDDVLVEEADEWYAQEITGDVWCFGRSVRLYDGGFLTSLDGSWRAGVKGAKPGIVMKAQPAPGDAYRLEYALGVAEEFAMVVSVQPSGSQNPNDVVAEVTTLNRTPLEPDEMEQKIYAPSIGLVREVDLETGEATVLIRVTEN